MNTWRVTKDDRDADGRIRVPNTERRLSDLLSPPATSDERRATNDRRPIGRIEIASIIAGLLGVVLLIALGARMAPAQEAPRAPVRPTVAQQAPTAAAPAAVPTTAPSATIAPPTATPEPPTQTPVVVYVEVAPPCDPNNPPYVVQMDVYRGATPLGQVTGTSCEGQAAAQANADALAAQMKGATP